jgi:hypothetical protein
LKVHEFRIICNDYTPNGVVVVDVVATVFTTKELVGVVDVYVEKLRIMVFKFITF